MCARDIPTDKKKVPNLMLLYLSYFSPSLSLSLSSSTRYILRDHQLVHAKIPGLEPWSELKAPLISWPLLRTDGARPGRCDGVA